MLPSATSPVTPRSVVSPLTELLVDPRVGCTSLNLSRLPDGSFRGTILRADGREWVKGYGPTPEAAINHLKEQI